MTFLTFQVIQAWEQSRPHPRLEQLSAFAKTVPTNRAFCYLMTLRRSPDPTYSSFMNSRIIFWLYKSDPCLISGILCSMHAWSMHRLCIVIVSSLPINHWICSILLHLRVSIARFSSWTWKQINLRNFFCFRNYRKKLHLILAANSSMKSDVSQLACNIHQWVWLRFGRPANPAPTFHFRWPIGFFHRCVDRLVTFPRK